MGVLQVWELVYSSELRQSQTIILFAKKFENSSNPPKLTTVYTQSEISAYLYIPKRTVRYYIDKYRKRAIKALLLRKAPGAQKKLTDEQENELKKVISEQTPEEAGIGIFVNWTAALACKW